MNEERERTKMTSVWDDEFFQSELSPGKKNKSCLKKKLELVWFLLFSSHFLSLSLSLSKHIFCSFSHSDLTKVHQTFWGWRTRIGILTRKRKRGKWQRKGIWKDAAWERRKKKEKPTLECISFRIQHLFSSPSFTHFPPSSLPLLACFPSLFSFPNFISLEVRGSNIVVVLVFIHFRFHFSISSLDQESDYFSWIWINERGSSANWMKERKRI